MKQQLLILLIIPLSLFGQIETDSVRLQTDPPKWDKQKLAKYALINGYDNGGVPHGFWNENGEEGIYIHGIEEGYWRYEDEESVTEMYWVHGINYGPYRYYILGELVESGQYNEHGLEEGIWEYFENGKTIERIKFHLNADGTKIKRKESLKID
tara:strand:+ start:63 stop:524 length:462 start_codon:yes stop_codon:yes gene_type:complete